MRFLSDESCDAAITRALRDAGHDVLSIAEAASSLGDEAVLDMSVRQRRVLLTEDKDFGRWVYADHRATAGVIFVRYPVATRRHMASALVRLVDRLRDRLQGAFTVVEPGRVRVGRRPGK